MLPPKVCQVVLPLLRRRHEQAPRPLPPRPHRLGRYVLLERLGAGGMAEVFRAVVDGPRGFQRTVVVKRILTSHAAEPTFVDMFIEEARILALLDHPNIVQVFDFGCVDGCYFLTMEMLRGSDLAVVLRKLRERNRHLPIEVAAFICQQVADGLAYAHEFRGPSGEPLNIVHCDVSPSNIMCLRTSGVKLLDFGVATVAAASSRVARKGKNRELLKGKISYMAPETLHGEPQDGRVDIFALGTVLWEALTGRRLFSAANQAEKVRQVLNMPIAPPSSLRHEIPEELDAIVMKALERDPAHRYATAAAMAEDLQKVVRRMGHDPQAVPSLLEDLFGDGPGRPADLGTVAPAVDRQTPRRIVNPTRRGAFASVSIGAISSSRRRLAVGAAALACLGLVLGGILTARSLSVARQPSPRPGRHGSANSGAAMLLARAGVPARPDHAWPGVGQIGAGATASAIDGGENRNGVTTPTGPVIEALPAPRSPSEAAGRRGTAGRGIHRWSARLRTHDENAAARVARGLPIDPFAEAALRRPPP